MSDLRIGGDLLKGLTGEERDSYKEYLSHNKELLDRIATLFRNKLTDSEKAMRKEEAYNISSWPYYQADKLGEQRAYSEIINILTLDREK